MAQKPAPDGPLADSARSPTLWPRRPGRYSSSWNPALCAVLACNCSASVRVPMTAPPAAAMRVPMPCGFFFARLFAGLRAGVLAAARLTVLRFALLRFAGALRLVLRFLAMVPPLSLRCRERAKLR